MTIKGMNGESHSVTSQGQGALNTVLGAVGTYGALQSGALGGLFGGIGNNNRCCGNSDDMPVSRYEARMQQEIAAKDGKIALLESNIYTDSKIADVYERLNTKIGGLESQICQQAVINSQVTANISCMQNSINTLMGLTKTIIPIGNVCPTPMPEFNSWTAPTAPTTGA